MRLGFRGYITTNFDPLLVQVEETHGIGDLWVYPNFAVASLGKDRPPVFHIHGLARLGDQQRGDNLILARSDFDEAYGPGGIVQGFLEQVLTHHSVVFWGCRLSEPVMYEVFRRVHDILLRIEQTGRGAPTPKRYMLAPKPTRRVNKDIAQQTEIDLITQDAERDAESQLLEERRRLSDMGIQAIWYSPNDPPRHRAVDEFLEYLCKLDGMPVSQLPTVDLVERVSA